MYRRQLPGHARIAALVLTTSLVLLAGLPPATLLAQTSGPQVSITEYPLPTPDSAPGGITVGPDGALWFHMSRANKLGRITTDGRITEYPLPTPNASRPFQGFVGKGSDGAIWFTENAAAVNKIGRLTMDGRFSEYPVPTPDAFVLAVESGPDGAIWFTEGNGNKVGRITPDGTVTEYPLPTPDSRPLGIVAGPDGAMWATLRATPTNMIARIAMDGTVTEYPVPTPNAALRRITAGPDGALWFAEYEGNKIGRITVDGRITEYPIPSAPPLTTPAGQVMTSGPLQLAVGPDRALWFPEFNANQIGRITPGGQVTEYPVPTPNSQPYQIVAGPDGALWFTEIMGNKIGRLTITGGAMPGLPRTGAGGALPWAEPPARLLALAALPVALGAMALLRHWSRRPRRG